MSSTDSNENRVLQERMARIGRKLLVLSGKGGVGKSTVAVNLAVALARAGRNVGLLDVDIHGPSIPTLLGLEGHTTAPTAGKITPIPVTENLTVMSIGFVLPGRSDPVIWRGPLKHNVIRQFLQDVAWGDLDYLIVDSPPGTGDEPLSVAQLVGPSAAAVIVTTPQDLAIADVRRCIAFCERLSLPIVGIVENMSGYVCPGCGRRTDIFKAGGGESLAAETHLPLLGQIPLDPDIVIAGDAGVPFAETEAASPSAKVFADVVRRILGDEGGRKTQADREEPLKENGRMKIAIPLVDGRLCMHFGHCEAFAMVEVDAAEKKILHTDKLTPPPHEPGVLPRWLHEQGANVIIAGGMGQRAQQIFADEGIEVVVGAPSDTPEELVTALVNGTLHAGENVCDH